MRAAAGFSILEVMTVVAILGIVAALAIPNFTPEIHKARTEGAVEAVAAFVARARIEAMVSKRCVRVWVSNVNPRRLVAERLNNFDCDQTPNQLPIWNGTSSVGLDNSTNVWLPIAGGGELRLDAPKLLVSLNVAPAATSACSTATATFPGSTAGDPAEHPCDEVVFRPTGRIWHQVPYIDTSGLPPTDEQDAVFRVQYLGSPLLDQRILVNSNGLICILPRGSPPPADPTAGGYQCPP